MAKRAVIIGAGPAGLTAALELLTRTDIHPVVIEQDPLYVGGISRTVQYKGNRIDVGGHRFFSKSDRVMRWWTDILPVAIPAQAQANIAYRHDTRALTEDLRHARPEDGEYVLHVRPRKSRIIYNGTFFAYPIRLSLETLLGLGPVKILKIGYTYLYAMLFPIRHERTLEDFFLNRFGRELYTSFFKAYTEKVWGTSCKNMAAEWGAQRVRGLSIGKAVRQAVHTLTRGLLGKRSLETSLIEHFLYPTFGPGQMWEAVAHAIRTRGGEVRMGGHVTEIRLKKAGADVRIQSAGGAEILHADYIFSSTDVQALIRMLAPEAPTAVRDVAAGLEYRAFLTVGLLLERQPVGRDGSPLADTWMYVHEPAVRAGRVQLFHNWSPALVAHPGNGWVGMEYFCNEDDEVWRMEDAELIALAGRELERIGLCRDNRVLDGTVIRQPKAYPGYFGSYERFDTIREYLDGIPYLFPIGRNGMHRYNNQDHSMLAAMTAVDILASGSADKSGLWSINTEDEYHESK